LGYLLGIPISQLTNIMGVKLRTQHLWISGDIVDSALGETAQVYVMYYPQQRSLLLAPMDDDIFPNHPQRLASNA
jgi:hypothetical protein